MAKQAITSRILTDEEQQLRRDITQASIDKQTAHRLLMSLKAKCTHVAPNLILNKIFKEYDSQSCIICGTYMGHGCGKSPDRVCHYYTTEVNGQRGVELFEGKFVPLKDILSEGETEDDYCMENETDDYCLFCGLPEERK